MIQLSRIMKIFGQHDADTVAQLERCAAAERNVPAVLCADHLGYSTRDAATPARSSNLL